MLRVLTLMTLLLAPARSWAGEGAPRDAEALARHLGETTWGMDELLAGKVEQVVVTLRVEELDGDGQVKHVQERVDRFRLKDGRQYREILHASRDGEDDTEALRKDLAERQAKGQGRAEFSSVNLPFAAQTRAQHRFFLAEPDPGAPQRLRLRFEPRNDKAPWVHRGEALVDPSTGQLLRLDYSPSILPDRAQRVDVRMDFRPQPGVGQVLDTLHVEAEGGFLFYKKHLRITAHYSQLVLPAGAALVSASK